MTTIKGNKRNTSYLNLSRIIPRTRANRLICASPLISLAFVFSTIVLIRKVQTEQKIQHQEVLLAHKKNNMSSSSSRSGGISTTFKLLSNDDKLHQIINGHVHLINISPARYDDNNQNKPYTSTGTFCHLDWDLHKHNPSSVPMNKDLIQHSNQCRETTFTMDIYEAITKMKEFDQLHSSSSSSDSSSDVHTNVHTMNPTGFVFHESRCGSTLVANSLIAYDPDSNRVYSESSPPISAAKSFDKHHEDESLQFLRDVIYLMGK